MFRKLTSKIADSLKAGDVNSARELLDLAWKHAKRPAQRKQAHDLGNIIQREIFAQCGMV